MPREMEAANVVAAAVSSGEKTVLSFASLTLPKNIETTLCGRTYQEDCCVMYMLAEAGYFDQASGQRVLRTTTIIC